MKIEVVDYIELADGGAVVTFEMDEETRAGLISEAIQRRIMEGLENMDDGQRQTETKGYLDDLADMEAGERMDSMEPTS
tara:strand:- start:3865 stop:4101 length:237 start_codon:yes stop_codon:yes gene_type:complete